MTVALRPRMWNKLEQAAKDWPLWLAAISGQMGQSAAQGFVLVEPAVQTFERKVKEPPPLTETGTQPPAPDTSNADSAPPALEGAAKAPSAKPERRKEPETVEVLVLRRRPTASATD